MNNTSYKLLHLKHTIVVYFKVKTGIIHLLKQLNEKTKMTTSNATLDSKFDLVEIEYISIPARDTVKPVRIPTKEEVATLAAELEDLANFTMEF